MLRLLNHSHQVYFSCVIIITHHLTNLLDQLSQKFDLAISLLLHAWPALSIAVREEWGGPDSSSKRDWFAGAISDLFTERSDTDELDVEELLLQVMADEFECNLEDESEVIVAREILRCRRELAQGVTARVDRMYEEWKERQARKGGVDGSGLQVVEHVHAAREGGGGEDDDDDDDDNEDDSDEAEDVEMGDGDEAASSSRPKPEPEVDEDGFTKVVGKRRR